MNYLFQVSGGWSKRSWAQVSVGQHHALGLDTGGSVWSVGRGEYGRLGLGREGDAEEPCQVARLGQVKCVDVSCGEAVSYAVGEDGSCWSWGMGTNGQLGTGSEDDAMEPTEMKGKALVGKEAVAVSGGGQHAVMLAISK